MTYSRLDYGSRQVIRSELHRDRDVSYTAMAMRVGCHRSTVQREIARNGGRHGYSSFRAQLRAVDQQQRRCHFELDEDLAAVVRDGLVAGYSPWSIAQDLPVCAETIYQGVYSGVLGVDPEQVLRSKPAQKKRKHRRDRQPTSDGDYLGDIVTITDRPDEINKRATFGHWEGDLICGAANLSVVPGSSN